MTTPSPTIYDDPDLYDALLPASAAHLEYYGNLARTCSGEVLELACGSGQLIVPIASPGVAATGLDLSSKMLAAAGRRADAAGQRVEFVEADMRSFDLGQRFSLIFIARNSLLHLSSQADFSDFFSSVRKHLRKDGILAFDIFNPGLRLLSRPLGERYHVMSKVSPVQGDLTVEATNDYDEVSQVNRCTWFVSTAEKRDRWVFPLHLRSIFPQELLALLAANGVELLRRDGDLGGGVFTGASSSQVCQCRLT
ncbi:MAG TPA: class I SAM-dependent methyltransferase [Steroidobacteraceae bacterium]|nr:class I SAM-dependent methyltransferase [Steroidobacteraceae bacterium]